MSNVVYSIAEKFTRHPGPRFKRQGPKSGEALRSHLLKLLEEYDGTITIDLDGTSGFGSSFLDEAFGGLIREEHIDPMVVRNRFRFVSRLDPSYEMEIMESIERAGRH